MKINTSYKVKTYGHKRVFKMTVELYRQAVDFLIGVCLNEWDDIAQIERPTDRTMFVERLVHKTKDRPFVKYDFDSPFYKFPSYLRRAAIAEAIGDVSSYKSNYANWTVGKNGNPPSEPKAGYTFPCLYKGDCFVRIDNYTVQIKVFVRNTWDWVTLKLKKSDVDYILHHCAMRKALSPTLRRRGKEWFLDFGFQEKVDLSDTEALERRIVAVDLGVNTPATISVMQADGTILDRKFYKLSKEQDSLLHALNRIKKAQQNHCLSTPRLWVRVKGINKDISVKTAQYIVDTAVLYDADVIVFEHLNVRGKKKGSKKQRLHHWRSQEVQRIVTDKAHRLGIRISRINPYGTSRYAYDGSGQVLRGKNANLSTYELCKFKSGKTYNCDLSASYNIGARYFIREILKSLTAKSRLQVEAKVPALCKRSTCTLADLINLYAAVVGVPSTC